MKKYYSILIGVFSLVLVSTLKLSATHYSYGHLTYRYIGDSTNVAREYLLELTIYKSSGGINIPPSVNVRIVPNGGTAFGQVLNRVQPTSGNGHPTEFDAWSIKSQLDCTGAGEKMAMYRFQGTVVLPAAPLEFEFIASLLCCREWVSNIPSNLGLVLRATLNRTYGENSLPKPVDGLFVGFLQKDNAVEFGGFTADKDTSDLFTFASSLPLTGPVANVTYGAYNGGNSLQSPLPTDSSAGGYQVNTAKGTVEFTPTTFGIYNVSYSVNDYKFDNTTQNFAQVGNYVFSTYIEVSPPNNTPVASGPALTGRMDSLIVVDSCSVNSIDLFSNQNLDFRSIDSAGTNFRVFSFSRQTVDTLVSVTPINARQLRLNYPRSISQNDTLIITTQASTDSTLIRNNCGFTNQIADTIYHYVKGCKGVALAEVESFNFSTYPNPAKETLELSYSPSVNIKAVAIMNLSGQVLRQYSGSPTRISLCGLAAGTYLLQVKTQYGSSVVKRLIKN